jgi:3D-(3,5/4)-trihydroxycyclohexane-1,2-dione acylhydrolase (decyclizing)
LRDTRHDVLPAIDFVAHAKSLGAIAQKVASIAELESALAAAKGNDRTTVLVIETDPHAATKLGGHWWDVPVPQVSPREEVKRARADYERALRAQRLVN